MICELCGVEYGIGDWPFCKGGHGKYGGTAIGDDIPGGQVIETMDHEPVTVYSHSQLREEADKRGLRLRDQWAGPGDRYLSNWAAVSPKTLRDAKAMLERVGKSTGEQAIVCETAQFSVRDLGAAALGE